jgi:hypothetical protein
MTRARQKRLPRGLEHALHGPTRRSADDALRAPGAWELAATAATLALLGPVPGGAPRRLSTELVRRLRSALRTPR